MNEWLVDTNVLLDVIGGDPLYGERSLETLTRLGQQGVLIVNPIIYAEVGALLSSLEELDELLPRTL
jgi:predicted nucleic acid-binding protein